LREPADPMRERLIAMRERDVLVSERVALTPSGSFFFTARSCTARAAGAQSEPVDLVWIV